MKFFLSTTYNDSTGQSKLQLKTKETIMENCSCGEFIHYKIHYKLILTHDNNKIQQVLIYIPTEENPVSIINNKICCREEAINAVTLTKLTFQEPDEYMVDVVDNSDNLLN